MSSVERSRNAVVAWLSRRHGTEGPAISATTAIAPGSVSATPPVTAPSVGASAARWIGLIGSAILLLVLLGSAIQVNAPERSQKIAAGPTATAPPTLPLGNLPITPEQAVAVNASIPVTTTPGAPASPLRVDDDTPHFLLALDCLTAAVYYEAASETEAGQQAVAQVVLNRVRHQAWPNTVCGVVYEGSSRQTGCQFSFTCDGSLRRQPSAAGWRRARSIAESALSGRVYGPVGNATHYHANYVVPYWASSLDKATVIGAHIFYRWRGRWGRAAAFRQRYAGSEPSVNGTVAHAATVEAQESPPAAETEAAPVSVSADMEVSAPVAVAASAQLVADEQSGTLILGSSGSSEGPATERRQRAKCRGLAPATTAGARAAPAQPVGGRNPIRCIGR